MGTNVGTGFGSRDVLVAEGVHLITFTAVARCGRATFSDMRLAAAGPLGSPYYGFR